MALKFDEIKRSCRSVDCFESGMSSSDFVFIYF